MRESGAWTRAGAVEMEGRGPPGSTLEVELMVLENGPVRQKEVEN